MPPTVRKAGFRSVDLDKESGEFMQETVNARIWVRNLASGAREDTIVEDRVRGALDAR